MHDPFAHLDLSSMGGHILARFEAESPGKGHLVVLSSPEQHVLPKIVKEELSKFDYSEEDGFAVRWHPYSREVPIIVDPHYAGGKPIVAGSNVSVDIISRRWRAGEKVALIARDFELRRADVEAVLQHVA